MLRELEDSEVPESDEGKGAVAMKLKNNLIKQLHELLLAFHRPISIKKPCNIVNL